MNEFSERLVVVVMNFVTLTILVIALFAIFDLAGISLDDVAKTAARMAQHAMSFAFN